MLCGRSALFAGIFLFASAEVLATIFGNVRGVVHDPGHRPIEGARVMIRALGSDWSQATESNVDGEFQLGALPVGEYAVTVSAPGFTPIEQDIAVASGTAPILHFSLNLAPTKQQVEVKASPGQADIGSPAVRATVNRTEIARTPGADRTNSLAMITDYLPGAYVVHDQLHVRGGHQVSWLIDGVAVPTNIASNVGPQVDPKDIDYIEMQSGGYSPEYGDRSYGVFNVVPRTGFEYNKQGELVASYGSFNQTNDQLSFGSHTERFAYYGSITGSRADLGLMTPTPEVIHALSSGIGGFGSLIFNKSPKDQLRLVTSLREDYYQVSNTPEDQASGIRDGDRESDAFANFSWVRTVSPSTLLTISPFYHFNRANYIGGLGETPIIPNDNRASNYFGAQASVGLVTGKHNAQFGLQVYGQHDSTTFGLKATNGSGLLLSQQQAVLGNLEAFYAVDRYKISSRITLDGGLRFTRFSGVLTETDVAPRVGASIQIPKLNWVLRGYYVRYYQPPPLDTVSGPLLELALQQGFGFLPLRGERDEQYDAGLTIPLRGWALQADSFRTRAHNFFDHDVLGNSNIFLPLTIQDARIRGWEATLNSPHLFRRAQFRMAFSHQTAQGRGGVTGGLTDFTSPNEGWFFLDHDQRNTVNTVFSFTLPRRTWASAVVSYGSGFLNGNGPEHLPSNTTANLSLGKSLGENWSLTGTALNLANTRFLVDNSNTFGGTHYNYPRQFIVELRYRFHL
jgi:hypothetical protein